MILMNFKCIVLLILAIKVKLSNSTDYGCESALDDKMCYSYLNNTNFKFFKNVDEKNCHIGVVSCTLRESYPSSDHKKEEQKDFQKVFFYKAALPTIPLKFFEDFPNILYLNIYSSNFQTLNAKDLKNANNLIDLEIRANKLASLSSNLFEFAKNLQRLTITDNTVTMILHKDALKNLQDLRILELAECKIEFISDEFLKEKSLITELSLFWNKIKSINHIVFKDLTALKILDLAQNDIEVVHENAFANLGNLVNLDLKRNKIEVLGGKTFQNLKDLKELAISENKLSVLEPELFHKLPNLVDLDINGNKLEFLPEGLFKKNPRLRILDGRLNKLKQIHQTTFEGATSLEHINLWGNQIQKVSSTSFSTLKSLNFLSLENNACTKKTWVPKYGTVIKSSDLESFFTNSDCAICMVKKVANGEVVSTLFGDPFVDSVKKFQAARVQCDPGFSYLEVGDDSVTCDGEVFNKEFPECISKLMLIENQI